MTEELQTTLMELARCMVQEQDKWTRHLTRQIALLEQREQKLDERQRKVDQQIANLLARQNELMERQQQAHYRRQQQRRPRHRPAQSGHSGPGRFTPNQCSRLAVNTPNQSYRPHGPDRHSGSAGPASGQFGFVHPERQQQMQAQYERYDQRPLRGGGPASVRTSAQSDVLFTVKPSAASEAPPAEYDPCAPNVAGLDALDGLACPNSPTYQPTHWDDPPQPERRPPSPVYCPPDSPTVATGPPSPDIDFAALEQALQESQPTQTPAPVAHTPLS